MTDLDEMHDVKGLALALKRNRTYVSDMRAAGFEMPGSRASLRMALQWLADHPEFTRRQAAEVRFARREQTRTNENSARIVKP